MLRLNHGRGFAALVLFVCFGAPVTSLTALHAQTSPTSQLRLLNHYQVFGGLSERR